MAAQDTAAQEMTGIRQELRLRVMEACMTSRMDITGRLIAAGRALVEVGREDFAKAAGLSVDVLALLEAGGSAWVQSQSDAEAIIRAFDTFGVVIVDEGGGLGAGVRLKFTRQDVKQLVRLETEGGIIRPDDSP
jgi:hypothetical protein